MTTNYLFVTIEAWFDYLSKAIRNNLRQVNIETIKIGGSAGSSPFVVREHGSSPCFATYQNQMPHYNESLLKIKMLDVGIS